MVSLASPGSAGPWPRVRPHRSPSPLLSDTEWVLPAPPAPPGGFLQLAWKKALEIIHPSVLLRATDVLAKAAPASASPQSFSGLSLLLGLKKPVSSPLRAPPAMSKFSLSTASCSWLICRAEVTPAVQCKRPAHTQ